MDRQPEPAARTPTQLASTGTVAGLLGGRHAGGVAGDQGPRPLAACAGFARTQAVRAPKTLEAAGPHRPCACAAVGFGRNDRSRAWRHGSGCTGPRSRVGNPGDDGTRALSRLGRGLSETLALRRSTGPDWQPRACSTHEIPDKFSGQSPRSAPRWTNRPSPREEQRISAMDRETEARWQRLGCFRTGPPGKAAGPGTAPRR